MLHFRFSFLYLLEKLHELLDSVIEVHLRSVLAYKVYLTVHWFIRFVPKNVCKNRCVVRSPLSAPLVVGRSSIAVPLRVLRGALETSYTYPLRGKIRCCNVRCRVS